MSSPLSQRILPRLTCLSWASWPARKVAGFSYQNLCALETIKIAIQSQNITTDINSIIHIRITQITPISANMYELGPGSNILTGHLSDMDPCKQMEDTDLGTWEQGFGSVSAWIRINLSCWIRIRLRIQIADSDPDPGGQKWPTKIEKSPEFSCF